MLGETLKKSREESGLDLHEVARTLRIQYEYLKALENGNLERLPPDVYVKAYIREYARFLNIDAGPLLEEYTAQIRKDVEEIHPSPPPEKKKSPLPRIVLSAFLFATLALVVYFLAYRKTPVVPVIPVTSSVREHAGAVPSHPEQQHTLEVTATETTWLRVEMDEGRSEEVLMKPGETRKWTSPNGFNLKVGNAGGIRLALDNRDIGVPGEKGRVIKLRLPEEGR